ncbi:hypothetical protein PUN28_010153 [Cardiocondyla obscurior]|uniref:Uncharacterized protein n=1 Tax=Cardiocondyla obscurior TaxID=286306 RepID=A0AAW2FSH6_9HYME
MDTGPASRSETFRISGERGRSKIRRLYKLKNLFKEERPKSFQQDCMSHLLSLHFARFEFCDEEAMLSCVPERHNIERRKHLQLYRMHSQLDE